METQVTIADAKLKVNCSDREPSSLIDDLFQDRLSPGAIRGLLCQYDLLPKLLQEMVVDEAIAPIECSPEDLLDALQRFYSTQGITSDADLERWCQQTGMTGDRLQAQIRRARALDIYKQQQWGHKLEPAFLAQKPQLDQMTYSLLRVQDFAMAQEIFFRIQSGEQSFAEATQAYSQGPEVQTGGLIGPIPVNQVHPLLATRLQASEPGQVLPPVKVGEWSVVVRLEQYVAAQLDEPTQQKLMEHLFQSWVQASVAQHMKAFLPKETV